MHYALYNCSTREPVDTVEMHVLARAYRSAWRSMWASDPAGPHLVNALDLIIDFGRPRAADPDPGRQRPQWRRRADRAPRSGPGCDPGSGGSDMAHLARAAAEFARRAHGGQVLEDGVTPYFEGHVLAVVDVLVEIGAAEETIAAGYLHDVVLLTTIPLGQIERIFGAHVAALVGGVSGVGRFAEQPHSARHAPLEPERLALEGAAVQTMALAHDLANLRNPLWLRYAVRADAFAGMWARLERLVLADDRIRHQVRAGLQLWEPRPDAPGRQGG